jgi:hypothetical protein
MQNGDRLLPACGQSELLVLEASPPHIEILCSNSDSVLIPRAAILRLLTSLVVRKADSAYWSFIISTGSVPSSSRPPTLAAEPLQIAAAALQSRVQLGVSSSANHPTIVAICKRGALPSHNVIRNEHVLLILTEAHSEILFLSFVAIRPQIRANFRRELFAIESVSASSISPDLSVERLQISHRSIDSSTCQVR